MKRSTSVLATLVVVVLLGGCAALDFGSSPEGVTSCNGSTCFTFDRFATPPMVTPPPSAQAGTVIVEGTPDELLYGIEGQIAFIRAVVPSGAVILEQPFDWPHTEHQLPPGAYQVTVYQRTCDGNCDYLDEPSFSCTADVWLEPGATVTVSWDIDVETPGEQCPVAY